MAVAYCARKPPVARLVLPAPGAAPRSSSSTSRHPRERQVPGQAGAHHAGAEDDDGSGIGAAGGLIEPTIFASS